MNTNLETMAREVAAGDIFMRPLLDMDGPPEVWEIDTPQFYKRGDESGLRFVVECRRYIAGRRMYRQRVEGRA